MALKKKGVAEVLDVWKFCLRGACSAGGSGDAGAPALQERVSDWSWLFSGRTWSRRKAPGSSSAASSPAPVCQRGKPNTLCDIPGKQSLLLQLPLPPGCAGTQGSPQFTVPSQFTVPFSLCRSCALHEDSEGAEVAVWLLPCSRSVLVGQFSLCVTLLTSSSA